MESLNGYLVERNLVLNLHSVGSFYKCGICSDILCDPKSIKCNCVFCKKCIQVHLDNPDSDQCPSCSVSLDNDRRLIEPVGIVDALKSLEIFCPRVECEEIVKLADMKDHLESCGLEKIENLDDSRPIDDIKFILDELSQDKIKGSENESCSSEYDGNSSQNSVVNGARDSYQECVSIEEELHVLEDYTKKELTSIRQEQEAQWKKQGEINFKLVELINHKLKSIKIEENMLVSDDQCKVTFTQISMKIGVFFPSQPITLQRYTFKIELYVSVMNLIHFSVYLVKGALDDQLVWPFQKPLRLSVLRRDGIRYLQSEFEYATSLPEFKSRYDRPKDPFQPIIESRIVTYPDIVLMQDSVSVILSILD